MEHPTAESTPDPLALGAAALGIHLDEAQLGQFARYHHALAEWHNRANLTSVTGWEQVRTTHFLDSLTVALALPPAVLRGGSVLDVGSGGGFPGLPLKIAFPGVRMGLLEANGKKASFLRELIDVLRLDAVTVHHGRAEDLARDPTLRETFDAVLARALARMPVLAELTLPFLRPGGLLLAQKKGDFTAEVDRAEEAIATLGGGAPLVRWLDPEHLTGPRALVLVSKVATSPSAYPRRPGMPAKHPLGGRGPAVDRNTGA